MTQMINAQKLLEHFLEVHNKSITKLTDQYNLGFYSGKRSGIAEMIDHINRQLQPPPNPGRGDGRPDTPPRPPKRPVAQQLEQDKRVEV